MQHNHWHSRECKNKWIPSVQAHFQSIYKVYMIAVTRALGPLGNVLTEIMNLLPCASLFLLYFILSTVLTHCVHTENMLRQNQTKIFTNVWWSVHTYRCTAVMIWWWNAVKPCKQCKCFLEIAHTAKLMIFFKDRPVCIDCLYMHCLSNLHTNNHHMASDKMNE